MIRRQLLSKIPQLFGLGLLGLGAGNAQETTAHKPLKIMMKSAWGSDDPTKAACMRLPKSGMKYKSSSWAKPVPLCESPWQVRSCPSAGLL
jgi:hypothetical protein